ncbi:PREDICTED: janus kinase and microtubule-interacting protein 1 isoform X2 [Cyprinodon variegatus]|uniref:janus kinase and microtubule-interacting protein 1 isoform X2 n=1 Tax=Cyprinodon variegatus TaxID=28743 RepID=UPI00074283DB|nr:PREDICTED: janus kinase and microtubule-interacting protein 1 isoform X2 [Cyprinodon variegatus]
MQLSQSLDQRLHMLRQEVRTMSQENDREEQVWRERLQRCQKQLKAKDEEMSRQSQYFENFKAQLQQKLSLARDREQSLQKRIYSLEKQLLDVTVSSATGMATITAVRITAGTVIYSDEIDRLASLRGEGEGEEENKDNRRKRWQPNVPAVIRERPRFDEGKTESDTEEGRDKEPNISSNETRLQNFIFSLQEDLKVLLEREEAGTTERGKLLEELQEAHENGHFLGCKVEELKAELLQLRQSESSLTEEIKKLREENQSLQQMLRDAANPTPPHSSLKPEAPCLISDADFLPCSPDAEIRQSLAGTLGKVQLNANEKICQPALSTIPPIDHRGAAEHKLNNRENRFPPASSKAPNQNPLNLFDQIGSKAHPEFQSLSFSTESLSQPKLGSMEENPSEESDALRAAFQSLGFGDDLQALKEQRDKLEIELQRTTAELQAKAQENADLKLLLRREDKQQQSEKEQSSSKNKITTPSSCKSDHHPQLYSSNDDAAFDLAQTELIQALNQENRALADRIQELRAHIELREEEIKKEQTALRGHVCRLEEDCVRLEQENQEQLGLISELTRKTEDDLNTIMELQQKLEESREEPRTLGKSEHQAGIVHEFQEEYVESLVDGFLKADEKAKLIFSQTADSVTTASLSSCQENVQHDSLQNISQKSLYVGPLTDEVTQLNTSIQSLKTQQKELTANISSLREEQKEVALSVQRQTEEKQQLTRSVWALKEQKDCIFQSLHNLKQEKEQLNRAVCTLKDERDQCLRSISGLNGEKEELALSLSALQRDKDVIKEFISSVEEERDRIMKSLQSLQTESDQLSQTVLHLKKQRDQLTDSLKGLREQRDQEQLTHSLKNECDQLTMTVSSLKEEEEKLQQSIICLKQEQSSIKQIILDLKEERYSLQTHAKEINQKLNLSREDMTNRTGETEDAPRCEISENSGKSEQIEALRAELIRSREELEKSHAEISKVNIELSQAEARCEVAEKKAAELVMRLRESATEREDIMKEYEGKAKQVKELQNKLMNLLREKTDALSLKAQSEEQYNILSAQLKAKTVALEELNSEYIALKRGQGSRDDQSSAICSLRARYSDIRAKYDLLLKRKGQTDLDVAPLKAKLSCLVVKCQERNSLLAEMMKSMHRRGCLEPRLTQQAEHLLSDAALQEYTAAFSPKSKSQLNDFTRDFFSVFQGCNSGFMPDPTGPVESSCLIKHPKEVSPVPGAQFGKSEKCSLMFGGETTTNPQDCFKDAHAAAEALKKNSSVSTSPSSSITSPAVPLKEKMFTNCLQLSSTTGSPQATCWPAEIDSVHLKMKEKCSNPAEFGELSQSPTAVSSKQVSPSRRLSSPEKILNLQEELQRTLMDISQVPESRGRGKEPRRKLSLSDPTERDYPKTTGQNFSVIVQRPDYLPLSNFSSATKHNPVLTTKTNTSNKSPTLFNAVSSRSANAKLTPSIITSCHLKSDGSSELLTSSDSSLNSAIHRKDSSICSEENKLTTHKKQGKKSPTMLNVSDETNTETFHSFCSESVGFSSARSHKAAADSTALLENTSRDRPGAPAEVRSVEVIKRVGQSSLLIGWERPPLDELGCSNATFVYGYRVFVNKEFHKSVMSSACTKCILENIYLSVPVHIGVQTLGSNGLCSDSVYTIYANGE